MALSGLSREPTTRGSVKFMQTFLNLLVCLLFLGLIVGILKVANDVLRSQFMRKYVSDRAYDVIVGIVAAHLIIAVVTGIFSVVVIGLTRL